MHETHAVPDDLPSDYESHITGRFESAFRAQKGDVFVDVGGHLGTWSLRLAPLFEHVVAFEPHPTTRAELIRRASTTAANVTVREEAIGDTRGGAQLKLYDRPGHSSISGHPVLDAIGHLIVERVDVQVVPLDTVELPGKLSLLKVDTEGYEVEVLRGALATLRRDRPRLCIETHFEGSFDLCEAILREAGITGAVRVEVYLLWSPTISEVAPLSVADVRPVVVEAKSTPRIRRRRRPKARVVGSSSNACLWPPWG